MPTGKVCPFISSGDKIACCYDKCEFRIKGGCLISAYMKSQIQVIQSQK